MSKKVVVVGRSPPATIPTKQTFEETRQLSSTYRSEINECNARIQELIDLCEKSTDTDVKANLESLLKDTITRKENLEQLLAESGHVNGPILRLPSELLALIMMCHVHDNTESPWILLAICRSWRHIGITTPRLWSLIHVISTPHPVTLPGPPYHAAIDCRPRGGVLCRNEEAWNVILDRSGAVPLDLVIECDASLTSVEFFCNILLQSGPRWRSVVFDIREWNQLWSIGRLSLAFPNLISAAFVNTCSGGRITNTIISALESTSHKLRSLMVRSSYVINALVPQSSLIQRTRDLDYGPLGPGFHEQEAVIWPNLSRLEILLLRDSWIGPSSSNLDHLTKLRVFGIQRWAVKQLIESGTHLKSLTYVYLESPLYTPEVEQHSITLAQVTHFTLVHTDYKPICWFVLPSIDTLELVGNQMPPTTANDEIDRIWNAETFGKAPSPVVLYLDVKANDAYLLMALRSMDRLTDLYLCYDTLQHGPSKLLDSLAIKPKTGVLTRGAQAVKQWVPPTCPTLERLSIIYKTIPRSFEDREEVGTKLEKVREARLGTAREMKEVRVISQLESTYRSSNLARRYMEEGLP